MSNAPKTVPELIDAFGGPAAFARAINLNIPSTASEMKRTMSIRVRYWPRIVEAAASLDEPIAGVTLESIAQMHIAVHDADHMGPYRDALRSMGRVSNRTVASARKR